LPSVPRSTWHRLLEAVERWQRIARQHPNIERIAVPEIMSPSSCGGFGIFWQRANCVGGDRAAGDVEDVIRRMQILYWPSARKVDGRRAN